MVRIINIEILEAKGSMYILDSWKKINVTIITIMIKIINY